MTLLHKLALWSLLTLGASADNYKFWCGKKYNATGPSFEGFNIGWPSNYDLPHGQEYHKIRLVQGLLPYLTTDTDTSVVAYVPRIVFESNGMMNVTISIPELTGSVIISPSDAVDGVSFPVDASSLLTGKNRISADVSYSRFENGTEYRDYLDTVFFDFYKVSPPSDNTSVVALDAMSQGISINGNDPLMLIGYYVANEYMFSAGYDEAEEAVQKYASEGYNVMMHVSPIDQNDTQMLWTLELCQKYKIYYQADVSDITGNLTALGGFIDQWSGYSSLLSYYIGNQPDGPIGIGSSEPTQSEFAYDFIKLFDPYHPITLVTNCAHSMPLFEKNVDFFMNDVYPVGIPDSYNGIECNATQGVCGCDLCDSTNAVKAIAERFKGLHQDLGVNYPTIALVEQTWYDNTSYWSRLPTYAEEFTMAWTSIISGGVGVFGFVWPVAGAPTTYPQLGLALSDFADYMFTRGLADKTVLSGARVAHGVQGSVYYAAWSSGYVVAVNTDYSNCAPLALFTEQVGLSYTKLVIGSSIGRNIVDTTSPILVKNGLLVDEIEPLSVKIYYL